MAIARTRPIHVLATGLLALASSAASGDPWRVAGDRIGVPVAELSFPTRAASISLVESGEASHKGEGIDNVAQYRSADDAVFGTVYVYYPGLPHAGLAAVATDATIRANSPTVSGGTTRVTAAGGRQGTALLAEYSGYRNGLASSAASLKAGRWLIGVRVSGPPARRAEVDAAMRALLDGIETGKDAPLRQVAAIEVTPCIDPPAAQAARLRPDPPRTQILATGFVGTFDGGGMEGKDQAGKVQMLAPRVPDSFCATDLKVGSQTYALLRAKDVPATAIDGRTVRAVLLSDSGRVLEVDHLKDGYLLLFHDLGETDVLGLYDAIPSDAQIGAILDGSDTEGSRIRVPIRFKPGQGVEINLPALDPPARDRSKGKRSSTRGR